MNKSGFFMGIIIAIVLLVGGFFWFAFESGVIGDHDNETAVDALGGELKDYMKESCAPDSCCHASSCVDISLAPDCSDVMCTEECRDGTMDCGQGSCAWVEGDCVVEWE